MACLRPTARTIAADLQARQDLSPWLAALYVAPEMRRHGISAAMVHHATGAAKMLRSHAPHALHLITDRIGYYEALGRQPYQNLTPR
jgi:GNAT superfamily N-acetyltransferase